MPRKRSARLSTRSQTLCHLLGGKDEKGGLNARERSTGVTNIVYAPKGRRRIRRLLDEIRVPSVSTDNVRLAEVLSRLRDDIKERDPEKRGFDLLVSSEVPVAPIPPGPIDPATGLPVPTGPLPDSARPSRGAGREFAASGEQKHQDRSAAAELDLGMALDAICKVADPPFYSVEDYAVVFLPAERPRPLFTRSYRVDRDAFLAHFGGQWTLDP